MRRKSITGPLLLLVIGGLLLWSNLNPNARVLDLVALYWPLILIAWGLLRAIEVLVWRREGYKTGLTAGEIVLIVFICIIGTSLSSVSAARRRGLDFGFLRVFGHEVWGQQFDFPISVQASGAGVKRIQIENPRGNVKITGADTDQVQVTGRKLVRAFNQTDAQRANGMTPVQLVPEGERLIIRTNQDRAPQNQRVSDELEIVLPRGVAIEGRTDTGDYEISDMAGNVEITSGNSDVRLARLGGSATLQVGRSSLIRVTDLKGDITIRSDGSDLELDTIGGQVTVSGAFRGSVDLKNLAKPLQFEGQRGTELRAQAVPGHISMDLSQFSGANLIGPVRLVVRSRDVKMEQFTDSLVVETERGDIELNPGKVPLPAMDVRAGSGRIDLELPPNAAFNLEATSQAGDAVNDFGPVIRKEVSGRSATLTGKVGNGPTVRLTAARGWISVRKQGSVRSVAPEGNSPGSAPERPEPKGSQI